MRTRIPSVPVVAQSPARAIPLGISASSRETCGQTRDTGAHLLIMEQGALCLPRHMQVPTCVCHLQAQRPSGERLRGNTCRLIVQDVRADPTCRQGQPREPPTLRSQDADMQLCTGHHCHSFSFIHVSLLWCICVVLSDKALNIGYSPDTGIGNVVDGKYLYIQDLLKLEATATGLGPGIFRPATPLRQPAWQRALSSHPDQAFSRYILQGITNGFHIGADRATQFRPNLSNMPSVQQQPQLVEAHLRTEAEAGRLLGPLPLHLARLVQTSPIGLIPKPRQPGKWRLIVDLSSPVGNSVNEARHLTRCMSYAVCVSV